MFCVAKRDCCIFIELFYFSSHFLGDLTDYLIVLWPRCVVIMQLSCIF